MGLFHRPSREDFPALPDGLYVAKLAKIANKVGKESGKPYISWGFELVQPPHQKRWVWANTQPTIGPRSQSGKFLTALGIDIEKLDDTFNEQSLVGEHIKVLVETLENEETGVKYQNVTKLMGLNEYDVQQLQTWLAQANTTGQTRVATQPVAAPVQQVPAAAPVSFPSAPVAFPSIVTPTAPVATPVAAPAPAVAKPKSNFPF